MERRALFVGSWYPADRHGLEAIVSTGRDLGGGALMGVLPHAGLMYSGRFIRDFFSNLDSRVDRVLVISPSHYHVLPDDTFVISSFDSAASPLGSVPVFRPDLPGAMVCDEAIQSEHALEMFIPFCAARSLAAGFAVVGDVSGRDALDVLARDVSALLDGRTALIASSDFTHYGRRFGYMPYGADGEKKAVAEDLRIASLLCRADVDGILPVRHSRTICGIVPAMIVSLVASSLGLSGQVVDSGTSCGIMGTSGDDFVSYVSIFWRCGDERL